MLEPGRVPARGFISRQDRGHESVTVAAVQRALNDRSTAYPQLAATPALSPGLRQALLIRGRDLSGGVPEED